MSPPASTFPSAPFLSERSLEKRDCQADSGPGRAGPGSAVTLVIMLVLSGCTVHQAVREVAPPVEMPAEWARAVPSEVGAEALPERWWSSLGDEQLNSFVDRVLEQNLDLRQAWARLDQARASLAKTGAAQGVDLSLSSDPSVSYLGPTDASGHQESTQVGAKATASYEIDLWGKTRSRVGAAEMEAAAAAAEVEATAQRLVGRIVDTWLARAEQRALRSLLGEQIETAQTYLQLVKLRFGQGQATATDLLQQEQQVVSLRAQIPLVDARIEVYDHQLAVLGGQPPTAEIPPGPAAVPGAPPAPAPGVPSGLLRRRPDVKAAERRVAAADHQVGAAVADRYPSLRIGVSGGLQGSSLAGFFDQWIVNLVGSLSASLWDGGARAAEVERAEARRSELLASFASVVLNAVREVEDALALERRQREYLLEHDRQLELANAALDQARAGFRDGQTEAFQVLGALQSVQSALNARRQLLGYRVDLYLALGGTWSNELEAPATSLTLAAPGEAKKEDDQ